MTWQEFPDNSRVWIYQADRILDKTEQSFLLENAKAFCNEWVSHGAGLKANADVFNDCALVLFVNQEHVEASGCSIDKSVRFVKQMEQELGVDFFNRMLVYFESNEGNKLQDFREGIPPDAISYFDNTITELADFKANWKREISDGWLAKLS